MFRCTNQDFIALLGFAGLSATKFVFSNNEPYLGINKSTSGKQVLTSLRIVKRTQKVTIFLKANLVCFNWSSFYYLI